MKNPILDIEALPSEGKIQRFRLKPLVEKLTWLVSERGMGNLRAALPFGENAVSYTYLGLVSDHGGILFSTPVPLPEFAKFSVLGNTLSIESPVPFRFQFDPKGLGPLLESYGSEHALKKVAAPIFGWNSWDHFNSGVTEEAVLRNMAFIAGNPELREKITHIIVDDGWQTDWGHWSANGKFPSGMKALADRIHAKGFKAGIWLAPLCAEACTPLYQLSPECFLKDDEGHPYLMVEGIIRSFYCLDVSVDKTRAFLRQMFRQVREWGYDYVKLDFLFNQAEALERPDCHSQDPSWSTNRHVAEMLKIAREELGAATHLLACNTPFELGGELFDEVRLTNDIGTFWLNADYCYQAHAARHFMSGKWFAVDPDFAVVRVPEKTWMGGTYPFHVEVAWKRNQKPGGWRKDPFWDLEEMRFALALVILSGGSVILGDDLPGLNEEGLRYANLALTYGGQKAARPLDFGSDVVLPRLWENETLFIAVNPGKTPASLALPASAKIKTELFTGEKAPADGQIWIPPHAGRLFLKG